MIRVGILPAALAIALGVPTSAQEGVTLGDVLVFRVFANEPPATPGAYVFKADRGRVKGQYLLLAPSELRPGLAGAAEYRLLSPAKVGPRPPVDVLGMHWVHVRPDRREAFERFVDEKAHPAVANLRPDLRILYYKPVGGVSGYDFSTAAEGGYYLAIFALTTASRDKYWPGGSDSDDLRAAFSPAVTGLRTELSSYLVEGSYAADPKLAAAVFESRQWTDFVLVKRVKEITR